ncbi:MAG: TRAP transporter large permease [Deltaproteobacteria bacterium]|nr:TRAP transporter large permease [Deltaproteobacteria bacterium]
MMLTSVLIVILFLALLLCNIPIALVMGICGMVGLLAFDLPLIVSVQKMVTGLDLSSLIAVLFFILGGEIMDKGGITKRLSIFLFIFLRKIKGGIAYVGIITNLIMAGVSGSAVADASATGSILIPLMVKSQYKPAFAAALIASAGTMGPLIPPSILFIIVGSMCNISILRLFLAGVLPGVFIALGLILIVLYNSKKGDLELGREDISKIKKNNKLSIKGGIEFLLAVMMPFLILGGMRFGIFTANEAGAIVVVYSMTVSFIIYRALKRSDLRELFMNPILLSANVLFIVAGAAIIGYLVARVGLISLITDFAKVYINSKIYFLIISNLGLFVLGCFMEITALAIILSPILVPLAFSYGIDPVQMVVIIVTNLMIGLITPPVGMNMYVTISIAKVSIQDFTKEIIPFILVLVAVLLLVSYVPSITLFLPNLLMK